MRIVVTGCYGFIGSHLLKHFASDARLSVVGIDNNIRGGRQSFSSIGSACDVQVFEGDLCDKDFIWSLAEFFADPDTVVFHCAAFNGTSNFYNSSFDVLKNSTLPTVNLLEVLGATNFKGRFVYFSSSEVYSWGVTLGYNAVPTAEDATIVLGPPEIPRWSYGASKAHGEFACAAAIKTYNIDAHIARIHNVYGPRMGFNHFIPDFIVRARANDFLLPGAEETRSFLFIEDMKEIVSKLYVRGIPTVRIINIGSAVETKIADVAAKLMFRLGLDPEKLVPQPSLVGSVLRRCPDITLLRAEVGHNISFTDLDVGLDVMVDHYTNRDKLELEESFR